MGGKKEFSDAEQEIWSRVWGEKRLGLSNLETFNAVDLLAKHLSLWPRILEFGNARVPFNPVEFGNYEKNVRSSPDGFFGALYLAEDIEKATGCRAENLAAWAYALGRQTWSDTLVPVTRANAEHHPFAPNFRPPPAVIADLEAENLRGRNYKTRFFSAEFVTFFFLAFADWENEARWHHLNQFWDKYGKVLGGVKALALVRLQKERDPLRLIPPTTVPATAKSIQAATGRRLPAAAAGLVNYNPLTASSDEQSDEQYLRTISDAIVQTLTVQPDADVRELVHDREKVLAGITARKNAVRKNAALKQVFDHAGSTLHDTVIGAYQTLHAELPNGQRVYYTFGGVVELAKTEEISAAGK